MTETLARPSVDEVWTWLKEVPDPEIPVVSVVDLGIVRDVEWRGEKLIVIVTPTYSGCPATSVISMEISETLRARGLLNHEIKTQISPAWTTGWMTQEARDKLKVYGIAPPVDGASCAGALRVSAAQLLKIECPRCNSQNTECVSQFGSTPCKASYRCRDCLEPFDYFKKF